MTGSHESTSPELTPAAYYFSGPQLRPGPASAGRVALGGYGQIHIASGHAATNTRVQLRNLETYVLSEGSWKRVQYSERIKGAFYPADYAGAGTAPDLATNYRIESSGGVSIKPVANRIFRFWPESGLTRSLVDPSNVQAVFTTVQAKLIPDNASAGADTSAAKLLVSTAAEWRASAEFAQLYATDVPLAGNFVGNDQIGNGKLRLAGIDWRAINFHSAANGGQVDALAVPLAGGTAPLANSTPLDVPRAKRVVVIGDSISEGGAGQDSFRQPLWNAIVSDAGNPLIDFVGSREGVSAGGSSCDNSIPVEGGTPVVPEFDQDHESYWGWCVDDVSGVLPAQLGGLAAADRRPDVALVHLGTNDIAQQGQSGAQVRADLSAMIASLRTANPAIRILLAQLIPLSSGTPALDNQIAVLNAEIASLAAQLTTDASPITVVDQNTGFTAADRYDGFHPNDSGERKMADKWLPALKSALQ